MVMRPKNEQLQSAYVGSALRGAYGHALRRLSCVMRRPVCTGCPIEASCIYTSLFEPRVPASAGVMTKYNRAPVPFVLLADSPEDPLKKDLNVGFRLFGQTIQHAPLVLHAFREAASRGLGKGRFPYEVTEVHQNGQDQINDPALPLSHGPPERAETQIEWELVTPLRLMSAGKLMTPDRFDVAALAMGLLRRIGLLHSFYAPAKELPEFATLKSSAARLRVTLADLRWFGLLRHSSRQKSTQSMSGMLGRIGIDCSDAPEWRRYLAWAPIVHLGKNTTMGLGRIRVI